MPNPLTAFRSIAFIMFSAIFLSAGNTFSIREPVVSPSPDSAKTLTLPEGERILDVDVSPHGSEALVLIESKTGKSRIVTWDLQSASLRNRWEAPAGLNVKSIAYHPLDRGFFLSGRTGSRSIIQKVAETNGSWTARTLLDTRETLRRLVVGPRPFDTSDSVDRTEYRLFFGQKDSGSGFSIHSITETGRKPYQVIGKKAVVIPGLEDYESPSDLVAPSALPIGFHPAGDYLFWEDAKSCFQMAGYGNQWGNRSDPLFKGNVCGGTVTGTPNGLAFLHWQPGKEGLESMMLNGTRKRSQCRAIDSRSGACAKIPVGAEFRGGHCRVHPLWAHIPMLSSRRFAWMERRCFIRWETIYSIKSIPPPSRD